MIPLSHSVNACQSKLLVPGRRVVANGDGGRPGITLVTHCGCQTMANLVQRWHKNHARIGLQFHLSHTGLACNRMVSLRGHQFMDDSPLFGTCLRAKGCKGDLPCGRERSAFVSRPFVCFASTARLEICLSLRSCNQLYAGLYCEKGIFLG